MLDWPCREGLLAYREQLRHEAMAQYRVDLIVFALLAPHTKEKLKAPAVPPLLKE